MNISIGTRLPLWMQAEKLQQWSGCKDATSCEVEMDFRVGGSFRPTMQIADAGRPFTFNGTYEEIVVPEKIGYRLDMGMAATHVLIELFQEGKRTKVVLTQDGFPNEDLCKIVSHGTDESLDKLDAIDFSKRRSAKLDRDGDGVSRL